jgi:AcrR family transcriptional regulator
MTRKTPSETAPRKRRATAKAKQTARSPKSGTPRKRRTAEEARTAILDAAEQRLIASGPGGIRLQEVAADVGVSHPAVLHHFGSREGLTQAVVARALASLHTGLLTAVQEPEAGPDHIAALLDGVFDALVRGGHARAFLWLALSGYTSTLEELRVRSLAEAVHEVRRSNWSKARKRVPPFEDTYFTVLLPALALLALSVTGPEVAKAKAEQDAESETGPARGEDEEFGARRFRRWLARLIHQHLEEG